MKVKLGLLCLLITTAVFMSSCDGAAPKNSSRIFETAKGYRADVSISTVKPVSDAVFKFDMTFTKPDKTSYIVTEPSEFKGMELTAENDCAVIDYLGSETHIKKSAEAAPISVLFDVPALIRGACESPDGGLREDDGRLVFEAPKKETHQSGADCFVYLDKESQKPVCIKIRAAGGEFEYLISFDSFDYILSESDT